MTSSNTFLENGDEKVLIVCQLDTQAPPAMRSLTQI